MGIELDLKDERFQQEDVLGEQREQESRGEWGVFRNCKQNKIPTKV
jgi:hypothetical protein